jgi:hypothetical protein
MRCKKTPIRSGFFFDVFSAETGKNPCFCHVKVAFDLLQIPFQTALQMPEILSHGRKFST